MPAASNGSRRIQKPPFISATAPSSAARRRAKSRATSAGWPNPSIGTTGAGQPMWCASRSGAKSIPTTGDANTPHNGCVTNPVRFHGQPPVSWFLIPEKWSHQAMKKRKRTLQTAAYGRKSGRHQNHSVAAQLKVIRRYARQRGLKIVRVATDGES